MFPDDVGICNQCANTIPVPHFPGFDGADVRVDHRQQSRCLEHTVFGMQSSEPRSTITGRDFKQTNVLLPAGFGVISTAFVPCAHEVPPVPDGLESIRSPRPHAWLLQTNWTLP